MRENSYAFPSVCQVNLLILGGSASGAVVPSARRWVQTLLMVTLRSRGFLLSRFLGVSICGRAASGQMWTVSALLLKMVGETSTKLLLAVWMSSPQEPSSSLEEAVLL